MYFNILFSCFIVFTTHANSSNSNTPIKKEHPNDSVYLETKEGDRIHFSQKLLNANSKNGNSSLLHNLSSHSRSLKTNSTCSSCMKTGINRIIFDEESSNEESSIKKAMPIGKPSTKTAIQIREILNFYQNQPFKKSNSSQKKKINNNFPHIEKSVDLIELFKFCCILNLAQNIQISIAQKALRDGALSRFSKDDPNSEYRCLALLSLHKKHENFNHLEYAWKHKDLTYATYCVPLSPQKNLDALMKKICHQATWIQKLFYKDKEKSLAAFQSTNINTWTRTSAEVIKELYPHIEVPERNKLLLAAIKNKQLAITQCLLTQGTDPNFKDTKFSEMPLVVALKVNKYHKDTSDIVAALLKHKACHEIQDKDGLTPLHIAATGSSSEHVSLLIKHGADINAQTSTGKKPIHLAFEKGRNQLNIAHVLFLAQEKFTEPPNNNNNTSSSSSTPF